MSFWSVQDKNGFILLRKSWQHIHNKPTELTYAALLIINTLTCFIIFFLIEYHIYGVHLLDIKTLESISPWGILDHAWHVILIVCILLFSIFSSLFIRASFNYSIITDLAHKKTNLLKSLFYTANHLQKLFFLSLIFLNHHIITLFDVINISPFLTALQDDAEGQKHSGHTLSKSAAGSLVVPVLLLSKKNNLTAALEESRRLIEQKLGSSESEMISFARIKILLFATAALAIIISSYFDEIDTLATSFIAGIVLLVILRIIEIGLTIYHGCLYSYCTGGNSGAFSPEELKLFL